MDSDFIFVRSFKLPHICIQVSSLHIRENFESISKLGNQFHVTLRMVSFTSLCYKK